MLYTIVQNLLLNLCESDSTVGMGYIYTCTFVSGGEGGLAPLSFPLLERGPPMRILFRSL